MLVVLLSLISSLAKKQHIEGLSLRRGIYLVQKATTIVSIENPSEAPRVILERLNIHDFH